MIEDKSLFWVAPTSRVHTHQIIVADEAPLIRELFRSVSSNILAVKACVKTPKELEHALVEFPQVDAVLCDMNFSGPSRGALFITELRARGVMPLSCAFLLMSDDPRRSAVLSSLESLPEAILLKPFTMVGLMSKINQVVPSRKKLAPLLELEQHGRWEELLEATHHYLREAPGPAYQKLQTKALIMLGRHKDGAKLASKVLQNQPKLAWAMEALAQADYKDGDYSSAEKRLHQLLDAHPHYLGANDLLAEIRIQQGEFGAAQRILVDAIKHGPHNHRRNRELGHVALLNKDLDIAMSAYHRALMYAARKYCTQEEDLVNAVRALLVTGDYERASKLVGEYSTKLRGSVVIDVLDHFLQGLRAGQKSELVEVQRATRNGLAAISNLGDGRGPAVLNLAAIEAALMAVLTGEALRRCETLMQSSAFETLPKAQQELAKRLCATAEKQNGLVNKGDI